MDDALMAEIAKSEAAKAEAKPTEEQVKEPQAVEAKETPEPKPVEKSDEKSVGELLQEPPADNSKTAPEKEETVPLAAFLELKKDLKALQKAQKENGKEKTISSSDLQEIAEEYGVDEEFIAKLSKAIETNTEKKVEAKYAPLLEKQESDKRNKDIDEIFTNVFDQAINESPEFGKIANKEVIKQLALNPLNAKKTVSQLLSETYGNVNTGKKSIETTQPAPNKEEKIDFNRMTPEEVQRVSGDPRYTKEYTDYLIKTGAI